MNPVGHPHLPEAPWSRPVTGRAVHWAVTPAGSSPSNPGDQAPVLKCVGKRTAAPDPGTLRS